MEFPLERNGVPIPGEVLVRCYTGFYGSEDWDRWLDNYPEYFAEERLHRDKWSYVTEEDWDAYYKELRSYLDPLDEELPKSKGLFYWIDHQEEYNTYSKEYDMIMKRQKEKREDIEEMVYNKHFSKYDLKYERKTEQES